MQQEIVFLTTQHFYLSYWQRYCQGELLWAYKFAVRHIKSDS